MVSRTGATTTFRGAPQAFQFAVTREKRTGRVIDISQFRGTVRGGIRTVTTGEQIREQQREASRRAQLAISRSLLAKAQSKLLRPDERAELERITAPSLTRVELGRPGAALSRAQQLRERERRQLQASTTQVLSEQEKIDIRRRELDGRFRVLQRLSNAGLLLPGVATIFNNQAVALRKDQENLIKKGETTQKKIIKFEKKGEKRTGIVPKSSTQLFETGLVTELQKERSLKKHIHRPLGIIDVRKSIIETEKAGAEFGAGAFGQGTALFGARVGAVGGRVLGTLEGVTRLAVDRPLFLTEKFIGTPLSFELGGTIGRDILIARRIPVLRELTGATQAREVRRGVAELGRPALREFGTSLAFFVGPEAIGLGLRGAKAAIKVSKAQKFFLSERLAPKAVREQAKRFGVATFQVETVKAQRLRQIIPTFEEGLTQRQLQALKELQRSQRFERDIKTFLKERRGELLPRRRPRQQQIQIQFPKAKPLITVPDPLRFARKDFFTTTRTRTLLQEATRARPRFPTAFRVPTSLAAISAARTSLRTVDLFGIGDASRTALKESQKFREGLTTFVGTIQATRGRTRTAESLFTPTRRLTIPLRIFQTLTLTTTKTPTTLKVKTPTRTRTPRRPIFPIGFPEIPVPEEFLPEPRKVQGFVAVVKKKPFKENKFIVVSNPLPLENAIQRGLFVSDVTIAQSAKPRKVKKKVRPRPVPVIDLRFKFRKKRNIFIEKRRFAIDTITEKQDLSVAKFLAQEKKRGISFFGVKPKRRTKRKRRKSK